MIGLLMGIAGTPAFAAQSDSPEQVHNGSFDQGSLGWSWYGVTSAAVVNGELCATVPGGLVNFWDAGILQSLPLVSGSAYTFSFRARSDTPAPIRVAIQLGSAPFTSTVDATPAIAAAPNTYSYTFTSILGTSDGQLAFQIGGAASTRTICLDDVSITGGQEIPPYVPDTGPRVRVNQVGYLPDGPKHATVVTDAAEPVSWELKNGAGDVVLTGVATPRGNGSRPSTSAAILQRERTSSSSRTARSVIPSTSAPIYTRSFVPIRCSSFILSAAASPLRAHCWGRCTRGRRGILMWRLIEAIPRCHARPAPAITGSMCAAAGTTPAIRGNTSSMAALPPIRY
jgi:hypothetical protein